MKKYYIQSKINIRAKIMAMAITMLNINYYN